MTTLWYMVENESVQAYPVNHYLENVKTLSSISIPITHNVRKSMLFSVQDQAPQVASPEHLPSNKVSRWQAFLSLEMLVIQGEGRGTESY